MESPDRRPSTIDGYNTFSSASTYVDIEGLNDLKAAHEEKGKLTEYVEWGIQDEEHPHHWSLRRRWALSILAFLFNSSTAMNATGYSTAQDAGSIDLHVTPEIWLTGSTAYLVPVAITPLLLAPLSEVYGRRPLYVITFFIYTMMFIPQALAPNFITIIIARLVQGCVGSVGNTMVAGTLADMFPKDERALPMSLFVLTVFMSQAVGSTASAWTVSSVGWRWMFWWQGIIAFVSMVAVSIFLSETRACVLLSRRARKLTQTTGKLHKTREDEERHSLTHVITHNLTRPVLFFFTEPIIAFLAAWIGFLWGVVFLSLEGIPDTFAVYNWTSPQKGTVLLTVGVGGLFGFVSNLHQSRIYSAAVRRHHGKAPPESRLAWSLPASIFTFAGLFWYAWTSTASISPVVPIIGLILFSWGTYIIYLASLNYIADAYETYAASGVACQALLRNIFAGTFGLFAHQMYRSLTPPIATTVLGCIAAALGLSPFVLVLFGSTLRKHSRMCRKLEEDQARSLQH